MTINCPRCNNIINNGLSSFEASCLCKSLYKKTDVIMTYTYKFTISICNDIVEYFAFRTLDEKFVIKISNNYFNVLDLNTHKEYELQPSIKITLDKPLLEQMDIVYAYFQKYISLLVFS